MQLFGYDQGVLTLSDELSTSSALVAKARLISHGASQIMAGRENFFWPMLACLSVRCFILVQVFGVDGRIVKDEIRWRFWLWSS